MTPAPTNYQPYMLKTQWATVTSNRGSAIWQLVHRIKSGKIWSIKLMLFNCSTSSSNRSMSQREQPIRSSRRALKIREIDFVWSCSCNKTKTTKKWTHWLSGLITSSNNWRPHTKRLLKATKAQLEHSRKTSISEFNCSWLLTGGKKML